MDDRKKDGEISVLRTGKGIDKSEIFAYNISVMYPGVAQLVARMVRVHEAVGSNPATRTTGEALQSKGLRDFPGFLCPDFPAFF